MEVIRLERGWPGYFIGVKGCQFRRNTLLTYNGRAIVISSIGKYAVKGYEKFQPVNGYRKAYFETMAFWALDNAYQDASSKEFNFKSKYYVYDILGEIEANQMHETIVDEISKTLIHRFRDKPERKN